MKGTLIGIGVGPGDPELITLKAIKRLQQIDIVIAPRTRTNSSSTALQIASPHLKESAEIVELTFPMIYDESALQDAWLQNKLSILTYLEQGKDVAFLTLGDPMLYSTYIYILRLLAPESVTIETIPGITSFCAVGSRVGFPLAEGDELLTIIPATCEPEKLRQALAFSDNVVLMKISKNTHTVIKELQAHDLDLNSVMVSKCGHPDEVVQYTLTDPELKPTYLSTILAKKRPRNGHK